jgi:hypothetical protein
MTMKVTRFGAVLFVTCLALLAILTTRGCSDRQGATGTASNQASGQTAIFETGKEYTVCVIGMPAPANVFGITVQEVGPGPWIRAKRDNGLVSWYNSNQFYVVMTADQVRASTRPG